MQPVFYNRAFGKIFPPAIKWTLDLIAVDDTGGPREARIIGTADEDTLYQLSGWLRYGVKLYDDLGVPFWWGYVSEISIQGKAYTWGVQLDTMANSVAVAYSYIEPGTSVTGQRKTTAYATHANSIAEYGTKQALISESGLSDDAATDLRDTALANKHYPQPVITPGGMGGPAQITLVCKGWLNTVSWQLAAVATNTDVSALEQIEDFITNHGPLIASQVFEVAAADTPDLPCYRDGDTDALTEIGALMQTGTVNGRRILCYVDRDRRAIWSEQPASTTITYCLKADGRLYDASGGQPIPYLVRAGVWVKLADVPATADTSLLIDASTQYMSGWEWNAGMGFVPIFQGNADVASLGGSSVNMSQLTPMVQGKIPTWKYLQAPLTSTSWDGDARSTTSKTVIDLSAVFGVPAGVKAVDVLINARDSASTSTYSFVILSPNDTDFSGKIFPADSAVNDRLHANSNVIPCNSDGDIYFQCVASGASTLDVVLQIWGYLL